MSKEEILADMIVKYEAYTSDWHNAEKWEEYVEAWKSWRTVKGDQ